MNPDVSQEIEQLQKIYDIIVNFLVNYSFQLIGAIFVFLVGLIIARKVAAWVQRICENKNLDVTLSEFIANVVKIALLTMVAVMCLNMIGISITPFIAAIGAVSLGAGLAVQGLLSNFGAGFNIILTRPFVVGDTISVHGVEGQVTRINLAYTLLRDENGVDIMVPNKHIVGEVLHNSGAITLLSLEVGVSYDSDIDAVLKLLQATLAKSSMVKEEPAVQAGIKEFADSCILLEMRCWVATEELVQAKHSLNGLVWGTLQKHQVTIPFPQREVLLKQV